jgi:hypothetical protein
MNKKNTKFSFNSNNMLYCPDKRIDTYYQICQFKNPFTNKYGTRKIFFDEYGNILKTFEKEHSSDNINKFIKYHKENKFKIFPVKDISTIDLPNGNDMIEVQSELLNNNNKEYNYKIF